MRACPFCGGYQEDYEFAVFRSSKDGMKFYRAKDCRTCLNINKAIRKRLIQEHPLPPPGTSCECCGKVDKLFIDHFHSLDLEKAYFRGYICRSCNSGIGMLGDSREGLERAVAYLKNGRDIQSIGCA